MKYPFIALEGLSAVGKTTIGKLIASMTGATFYKTPASIFGQVRPLVDQQATLAARFFFYLAGIAQSSLEIEALCVNGPVVCDRYLHTTVCYHEAMGVPAKMLSKEIESVIKMPDFSFLLTCEDNERIRRLYNRGLSYNDTIERSSGIEAQFLEEYEKMGMIKIDNSSNDPEIAARKIIETISLLPNK